ncbi:MAG: Uma2 family endonuclease, partial [Dehalococcoidia bacterium]|nr:Uma2 family endonuclease [Dehalococcoidia bacterium]
GKKYELVRGVLVEKVATGHPHSVVVAIITTVLSLFAGPRNYGVVVAGEPGYLLEIGPDTVRCPDVAWVAPERIPMGFQGFPDLVPDLVVEVKSPSNSYPEMRRRAEMWLGFGARQVWSADPDRATITRYAPGAEPVILDENDIIDGGDLLPDFTAPVWSLFRWQR